MNNKTRGNKFEEDFASYLSEKGFWVHLVAGANHTGSQPCDIIACLDGSVCLIDCKTLENKTGRFPLTRLEENQRMCYKRFRECGNTDYFLAILWNNDVYYVDLGFIDLNDKSVDLKKRNPVVEGFYEN